MTCMNMNDLASAQIMAVNFEEIRLTFQSVINSLFQKL